MENSMQRILVVVNGPLLKAGVPSVVLAIVRNLKTICTFDVILTSKDEGFYDNEFLSLGGRIFRFKIYSNPKSRFLFPVRGLLLYRATKKISKLYNYVAIHCHNGFESGFCLLAAKASGVETRISHAHGTYQIRGNPLRRFYYSLGKMLIESNATSRVACSKIAGETLFGQKSYVNVLNPISSSEFMRFQHVEHKGVNLLQIGYFQKVKNQLFSILVVRELRKRGLEVRLDLIGFVNDEGYFNQVKEAIARYNLSEAVFIQQGDCDQKQFYSTADFVLLPSESEGLPLVALEAQAAGVECLLSANITTEADLGLAEYLEHNNITAWAEYISAPKSKVKIISQDKLKLVSEEGFSERIASFYNLGVKS